ncbi:hypothetical protein [Kribbella swartbergensis]
MDNNLRRATALIRDEERARRALDRHSRNRYDLDAVRQVRRSVEGLVETLEFIAADEAFWNDLSDRAHVLAQHEIVALGWFNDDAFGALLTACGYHSPPPPPVDELISDTRYAIANALVEGPRPDRVHQAQRHLILFLMRTRRQLELTGDTPAAAPEALGRRICRVARKTIPIVAGIAAGTALEALLPSGHWISGGYLLGSGFSRALENMIEKAGVKSVEELAQRAADWATATAIGDTLLLSPPAAEDTADSTLTTPDEAIAAHLAIAQHQVSQLAEKYSRFSVPVALVDDAARHLQRVIELGKDHDANHVLEGAARLALEVLAEARRTGRSGGRLEFTLEALQICQDVRGEPSQFQQPSYVRQPFGHEYDLGLDESHGRALQQLVERWREMSGRTMDSDIHTQRNTEPPTSWGVTQDENRRDDGEHGYLTY